MTAYLEGDEEGWQGAEVLRIPRSVSARTHPPDPGRCYAEMS